MMCPWLPNSEPSNWVAPPCITLFSTAKLPPALRNCKISLGLVFKLSQFITARAEPIFTVVVLPLWPTPAVPAITLGLLGVASATCIGKAESIQYTKKQAVICLR